MIVEERDHVLTTRFSRLAFNFSIFSMRWSATNGPFLSERPMLLGLPAADDHLRGPLVAARLLAHGHLTPRRGRRTAGGGARLATAVRVVDRVHRDAAHRRSLAEMALTTGLADHFVLVVEVAELADRRAADGQDAPHLARGHAHLGVGAFFGHQLGGATGRAHELAALTGPQLDVVDDGPERDVLQREGVAGLDVGGRARFDDVTDLQAGRREDVALLAVPVVEQREASGPVRIVLDRRDLGRNRVLGALEVDQAVLLAVAAALVAGRDVAVVVTARVLLADLDQRALRRLLGELAEIGGRDEAPGCGRRLVLFDGHLTARSSSRRPAESSRRERW